MLLFRTGYILGGVSSLILKSSLTRFQIHNKPKVVVFSDNVALNSHKTNNIRQLQKHSLAQGGGGLGGGGYYF